jgi:AraC-like DNA-binding protein
MIGLLDENGAPTDGLIADFGLSRRLLEDPYAVISLRRYVELFEAAAVALDDRALGLRLGMMVRPAQLGPLGMLFAASGTLRSALQRLSTWLLALQSATHVELRREEDHAVWSYQIEPAAIWPRVQDAEFSLAAVFRLARASAGPSWRPLEVHFEHEENPQSKALYRGFEAPVRFKQPMNRLFMDNDQIDRKIQTEDLALTNFLERHIRDLASENADHGDIERSVTRLISLNVGQGRSTLESIAGELGLSPRTLQRRLEEAGSSFRTLLRKHRQGMAELRIRSGRTSQADIAHTLGYSDGTAFWRAFKSWTGATPSEFRRRAAAP